MGKNGRKTAREANGKNLSTLITLTIPETVISYPMKLTIQEKIESTVKFANSLISAGWERMEAIENSQNLWHLSKKSMKVVQDKVDKSCA